ncbi:hypothetical protein AKJ45_01885 [candidate division MSBL1 archaeon SCGC-AAA261F19]|uniref:Digeranylgeranylglycerophospholipid reductase n=2 Tax=candidate division MSBL1 TaxID=215777 RepID=A0A133VA99_9EURY|nr:hypothetical protein AKJ43_00980 [candidate division MSBL1 archaeon SCGC-AAA261D19]KXB03317.1 hypothetical protein AKJ45_01885 [candidate division MSBL1 archaeon SCGC-AAA261F19]
MSEKYDILVVGAGPAGSTAARLAAENGANVLMVDKRHELGTPVQCGEALGDDILNELDIEPDPRWAINKIDSAKLVSPSGIPVVMREKFGEKVGYILDRKVFDKHLAILAARAGADIRVCTFVDGLLTEDGRIKGVTARSLGGKTKINADIIIAADGIMSRVAWWAGVDTTLKPSEIESGIQFKMTNIEIDSTSFMEYYFSSEIAPGGYAWIFPRGDDTANVGLGVLGSLSKKPPIEYLRDFVKSQAGLRGGEVIELNGGGIPVSGHVSRMVKDNIMIVGDAARQVNPMTGGGMNWSMRAASIAGEVSSKAVENDDVCEESLSQYEDRYLDLMGEKMELYRKGKDIMLTLSDEELDSLAEALEGVDFDRISLTDLLEVIAEASPKLMGELEDLF